MEKVKNRGNLIMKIEELEKIKKIMFNLFTEYEDCDEIIDTLRSLETEQEITEEEYDYAMKYWDEILVEWENQ